MNPISLLNTHHTDFEGSLTTCQSYQNTITLIHTHNLSIEEMVRRNILLYLIWFPSSCLCCWIFRIWLSRKDCERKIRYKTKQCSKKRGNFSRLLPKVTLSGFYRHLWIVWLLVLHCQLLLSKLSSHQNTLNPKISKEFWSKN